MGAITLPLLYGKDNEMKYHKHNLKKISADLGYDDPKENYLWEVYDENGELIGTEPCLEGAKEVADYGESSF